MLQPRSTLLSLGLKGSPRPTGMLSLAKEWDVWMRGAVTDRGDLGSAASVLPILDGGFDQKQLTLGVTYRSGRREPKFSR